MNFQREQSRTAAFDLTPMIDVVLQLIIIFFMYTTQFAQVMRSELDLPQETGEGGAGYGTRSDRDRYRWRWERCWWSRSSFRAASSSPALRMSFASQAVTASKVRLLIRADRNAPTGRGERARA